MESSTFFPHYLIWFDLISFINHAHFVVILRITKFWVNLVRSETMSTCDIILFRLLEEKIPLVYNK